MILACQRFDLTRYIDFYLGCVVNEDNVSYLYYIATRLKTVRDAESQLFSDVRALLYYLLTLTDVQATDRICISCLKSLNS